MQEGRKSLCKVWRKLTVAVSVIIMHILRFFMSRIFICMSRINSASLSSVIVRPSRVFNPVFSVAPK